VVVRTANAEQLSIPDIGSPAAAEAVSEAAAEAASLVAEGMRKEATEQAWVFPPGTTTAGRPVRITPAEEEV
jgi:hypothetical protein